MKTLDPVTVGDYAVTVTVEEFSTHMLLLTAKCKPSGDAAEDISAQMKINPQCEHDHTDADFESEIARNALLLARECAGKCRAADLRAKFLKG